MIGAASSGADVRARLVDEFDRVRAATDELLSPLGDDELVRQISPLQSPLVWDLAHIAYFEELWLLRRVGGAPPLHARHDDIYDAFAHERSERSELPILRPEDTRAYAADVRRQVLALLEGISLDPADPLLADGYVFGMVLQHELQHQETMLQTLSLADVPYDPPERRTRAVLSGGPDEVVLEGGHFMLGAEGDPWAYDNELPAQEVELDTVVFDRSPVSYAAFAAFVEDGYGDDRWWSEEGRCWRNEERAIGPLLVEGGIRRRFGRDESVPADEPVQHVCWHEADAYARWTGKRLPNEIEWEKAAKSGLLDGVGAVWEWTSSWFQPYPGFRTFPYAEYSEVFFSEEYRVLRGASWATDPLVSRISFRNWDYPQRRQIFAGFRCARDA